jgi:small multidrug resistance family-3 protein
MLTILVHAGAALAEIAGCFSFWAWLRLDKSALWIMPGMASLALFAYLLTLVDATTAGRVNAAYGGVYIVASILWLWLVENSKPGSMGRDRDSYLPLGCRCYSASGESLACSRTSKKLPNDRLWRISLKNSAR